uniref:Uncharacterized protein n=1 Tax=Solanum tuberosum TaxID=4113 RepID=M0ZGC8_SOLTU
MVLEVCYPPGYPAKAKIHLREESNSDVQSRFGPIICSTSKVRNFKQTLRPNKVQY